MTIKKYDEYEVRTLLKAIDEHLKKQFSIILIGGTAALLAYKVSRVTQDIDTYNNISALLDAYKAAQKDTGLNIPFSQSGIADFPYNFEDRLVEYKGEKFKNLIVKIPEIHDFILSKIIRGYEHDMETIEEVVKKNKVNIETLKERFSNEMDQVIGDKKKIKLNFLVMLERC